VGWGPPPYQCPLSAHLLGVFFFFFKHLFSSVPGGRTAAPCPLPFFSTPRLMMLLTPPCQLHRPFSAVALIPPSLDESVLCWKKLGPKIRPLKNPSSLFFHSLYAFFVTQDALLFLNRILIHRRFPLSERKPPPDGVLRRAHVGLPGHLTPSFPQGFGPVHLVFAGICVISSFLVTIPSELKNRFVTLPFVKLLLLPARQQVVWRFFWFFFFSRNPHFPKKIVQNA